MKEKIVFVTGANKGIGFGIAKHLGKSGWQVIISARDKQRAEKAINELKSAGVNVLGWVNLELRDLNSIEQAAKEIQEKYAGISLLINNAGIGKMGESIGLTDNDVASEIDINCKAVCLLCSHAIPFMKPGSRILNISSASSFQPVPYINLYAASKAFVRSYTRALNVELRSKGITCTAVCPGWIPLWTPCHAIRPKRTSACLKRIRYFPNPSFVPAGISAWIPMQRSLLSRQIR